MLFGKEGGEVVALDEGGVLRVFLDFGCGAAGFFVVTLRIGGISGKLERSAPLILALGQ